MSRRRAPIPGERVPGRVHLAAACHEHTQREIAKLTGVSKSAIGRIIAGEQDPSLKQVFAFLDAFEITLEDWRPLGGLQKSQKRGTPRRRVEGMAMSKTVLLAALKTLEDPRAPAQAKDGARKILEEYLDALEDEPFAPGRQERAPRDGGPAIRGARPLAGLKGAELTRVNSLMGIRSSDRAQFERDASGGLTLRHRGRR